MHSARRLELSKKDFNSSARLLQLRYIGEHAAMLAVLGEYIWRALEEARKRPPFIIDRINKD